MTVNQRPADAFRLAVGQFTDTVYRVAVHNTPCTADAQDVTQDVFLRLLQCGRHFRDEEHMKAWLIRVTINLCRNRYRSRKREVLTDTTPETAAPSADAAGTLEVLDAVRALPENQRNAIYLHYYEGYTAAEIAAILGSRTNTVLSWLRRGRESLRHTLGGSDDGTI